MSLTKYYTQIYKEPLISKEEELELFIKYKDSSTSAKEKEAIRERIIKANLRFAFKQAKAFSKNDPGTFEDLISAGNEGLIVGFEKYNPSHEVRYLSYAGWWVNQRILKEMSRMRIVALPIWKQQLGARIQKLLDNNEKISIDEIIAEFEDTGISEKDIREMYRTRYLTYYIDDMNENEFEIDPIGEDVQKRIDDTRMWKMVSSLPSPHREVIARCYGLEEGRESSPAKIAKALKISKDSIQKIKVEGLQMLRDLLAGKKDQE